MSEYQPRIFAAPPPQGLTFGGYRLCHGCSRGVHANHVDVACQCDICGPEETK